MGCDANHNYVDGSSNAGYIFNPDVDPVLLDNANNIITNKCMGCHGPGSPYGHLNFTELINDGYITAGPPEHSVLHRCLNRSVCVTRDGNLTDNMAENAELLPEELETLNEFIDALFIDPS